MSTKKNANAVKNSAAPKSKPRTEAQKQRRRERDAKRREKSASDTCSIEFKFAVGGVSRATAELYGDIMQHVFHAVSYDVKNILNAIGETFKSKTCASK